ncbi:MAG: hypothetical protein ACLUGW_08945, partial [Oscillospiraceae bacterium]
GGTLVIVDEKKGGGDPAELCRRCGLEPVELEANDVNGIEAALRAESSGARAVIVRGECALLHRGGAGRSMRQTPTAAAAAAPAVGSAARR